MDILSTLKNEYSRTLVLIVIPGGIALFPFSQIIFTHFGLTISDFVGNEFTFSIIYLFASIFLGFLIQDLGARIEICLDKLYCKKQQIDYESVYMTLFKNYLFKKRAEDHIVTHYYRAMLIRLKFELHTIVSIFIFWIGLFLKYLLRLTPVVDCWRTLLFLIISASIISYLLYEAKSGVSTLHEFRSRIVQEIND